MMLRLFLAIALTSSAFGGTLVLPVAHGAAAVDVAGLVEALGPALQSGPLAEKLDEAVRRGLPDPRRDVSEAAVAIDLRGLRTRSTAVVTRGQVDASKVAGFFAREGSHISKVAYRGVVFTHVSTPGTRRTARAGTLAEDVTLIAWGSDRSHLLARRTVDAYAGRARKRTIPLPAGALVTLGLDVPERIRKQLAANPATALFATVTRVTGTVRRDDDRKLRVEISLACDSLPKAFLLKAALAKMHKELLERTPPGPIADFLATARWERDGKTVSVTMEAPSPVFAAAAAELVAR